MPLCARTLPAPLLTTRFAYSCRRDLGLIDEDEARKQDVLARAQGRLAGVRVSSHVCLHDERAAHACGVRSEPLLAAQACRQCPTGQYAITSSLSWGPPTGNGYSTETVFECTTCFHTYSDIETFRD